MNAPLHASPSPASDDTFPREGENTGGVDTDPARAKRSMASGGAAPGESLDLTRLWVIDGKVYDLEPFLDKHPGGRRFLEHARGTDCSALFRSTHLHDKIPWAMLARYEVAGATAPLEPYVWPKEGFYETLKRRVREHFETDAKAKGLHGREMRLAHHGTPAFIARFFVFYAVFVALSVGAIGFGLWWCALLWGPFAFALGGYGHEAMHGGVFKSVRANRALALLTLDFMGVSSFVFTAMHVPLHHIHTNVPGRDPDIEVHYPAFRERANQPRMWFHRFQHLYVWLIYAITFPVLWVSDFIACATGWWFGPFGRMTRPYRREALFFVLFKGLSLFTWYVLPFLILPWPTALLVLGLMIGGAGLMVQGTFALSHQNVLAMNVAGRPSTQPDDWGALQLETTVDFRHGHWLPVTFFGGLGYQIEHHLFPTISYSRLDEIVPIVKQTCAEFDVPYYYYPTAWSALRAHYVFLRELGAR